mgnify:CR=1 FL=1
MSCRVSSDDDLTRLLFRAVREGDLGQLAALVRSYPEHEWAKVTLQPSGDTLAHCAAEFGQLGILR